jgi:pimeloyl-ACP methyl ester carboxylesterase
MASRSFLVWLATATVLAKGFVTPTASLWSHSSYRWAIDGGNEGSQPHEINGESSVNGASPSPITESCNSAPVKKAWTSNSASVVYGASSSAADNGVSSTAAAGALANENGATIFIPSTKEASPVSDACYTNGASSVNGGILISVDVTSVMKGDSPVSEAYNDNGASSANGGILSSMGVPSVKGASPVSGASYDNGASSVSGGVCASVDVVLFGVGDLRVDDHLGLKQAICNNEPVLPLCLLQRSVLARIPGATSHTSDTAELVHEAITSLDHRLRECFDTSLVVQWVDDEKCWEQVVVETVQRGKPYVTDIRVHVCDLGKVDNEMGYGAYAQFSASRKTVANVQVSVVPWTQGLRAEPWIDIGKLPDRYPDYKAKFSISQAPILPFDITSIIFDPSRAIVLPRESLIPTSQELQNSIAQHFGLDPARVQAESRTGLFATHWGGLVASSVSEARVLSTLHCFSQECQEDDAKWHTHQSYIVRGCRRHGRSLEHATMAWQLRGDGTTPSGNTNNWLAGESMVRFLAAPLLLGTISPRRVWHASTVQYGPFFASPLKSLVEGQEWHRLLAAHHLQKQQGTSAYKYWRYHGFLCRYAQTDFHSFSSSVEAKEGILLVHGFGASGAQWDKLTHEISVQMRADAINSYVVPQALAPDMLGFGHSEKPAISYTAYLWDAMMQDFVKDVAQPVHGWESFVTGGNSIGGFTSMSMAASDMATISGNDVSSSGAPGTHRCSGLVLMNTAGPVESVDQVTQTKESIAQATARDGLPPCKPPPRLFSRIFGNVMMGYLRPRIGSICSKLYPTNPAAVDANLCNTIFRDSLDPGAINVMMAGAKLPPPRTANEMLAADFGCAPENTSRSLESVFDGPVLIAQGVLDPLNDAKSRMDCLASLREGIDADPIQAGHCPHDEVPVQVAQSIVSWMRRTLSARHARVSKPFESSVQTIEEPSVAKLSVVSPK